jgi:hypothetical protein
VNMPRFTAEASLYKTSGHYRTGRVNLSAEMIRTIHPAREVIEIHDCPPGESRLGGTGPCWPDPLTEPSVGQGGESSGSGGAGEGSGPGGGVSHGKPPKDKPKPPGRSLPKRPPKDYRPERGKPCHAVQFQDVGDGVVSSEIKVANGTYYFTSGPPGDGWECSSDRDGAAYCNNRYESPRDGSVFLWQCHNGP